MPTIKDLAQLGKLIAPHHGWAAAKAFKAATLTDAERAVVSQGAVDLLTVLPPMKGAGAMMSAALAVRLEGRLQSPAYVVTGVLSVEGVPVLGQGEEPHAWLMIGGTVVDIAMFRAAYASWGPPRLARHVDLVFGPNKALYADQWQRTARHGLTYEPRAVLARDAVTALMGDAYHAIKAKSAN